MCVFPSLIMNDNLHSLTHSLSPHILIIWFFPVFSTLSLSFCLPSLTQPFFPITRTAKCHRDHQFIIILLLLASFFNSFLHPLFFSVTFYFYFLTFPYLSSSFLTSHLYILFPPRAFSTRLHYTIGILVRDLL